MTHDGQRVRRSVFIRKSVEQVQREAVAQSLNRTLGPVHLVLLGVGAIVGSGIFVLTGTAAANFAGPALMLSFVFAGLACGFTGLCYAELASTMPACGSAYTYSYATLGEVFAWITGWLMLLEYGVASSLVAVGFSGYAASLLRDFGIVIPPALTTPFIDSVDTGGGVVFTAGHGFNLVAALGVLAATALLLRGITTSAAANSVMVFVKITVLLIFVAVGVWWIDPANWTPFIPEHEGGFTYGWPGVFRAASVIFFAYVGFETVSTACAEARNPQRDMPIGILGALLACTVIYIAVAAVLIGVVPFRLLDVPDPIALAVDAIGMPLLAVVVKIGAVAGLCSVMLASMYGQTRVFYTMSNDGLLPRVFASVHARFRTPFLGTIVLGVSMALAAGLLPISILADIVSLGVSLSFGTVCVSVMWLRSTRPDLARPFRVPLGGIRVGKVWIGVIPALGVAFCILMAAPLVIDITVKAFAGNRIPAILLLSYFAVGAVIYASYGFRHSQLSRAAMAGPTGSANAPTAMNLESGANS
ncbi:MAG: amino acid permease [Steroidobacteraceae bacterium]